MGSGGVGRRTELVGGFGQKKTRRGTGNVLPASHFLSEPSYNLGFFSLHLSQTVTRQGRLTHG